MVPNARAGSWLMAAYWSNDAMKAALARPDALESGARNGQSPLEVVAPKEAGRLALRGDLPQSPYVAHGLTELKSLGVTEVQVAQVDTNVVAMPAPSDWRAQRQAASQPQVGVEAPVQTQQAPEAQDSAIGVNPQDLLDNLPSSSRRKPGM